jgi:hypothetical protein
MEGVSSITMHRWHTATNTITVHARRAFNAITEHMYKRLINMVSEVVFVLAVLLYFIHLNKLIISAPYLCLEYS